MVKDSHGNPVFELYKAVEMDKYACQTLRKKYGNKKNYRLHCHITNPHFKPEDMNKVYSEIFEGKQPPFNIILPKFLQ